ncbi:MAG TPA: hypothetical protein PK887_06870 [Ignavibacteriales bacterium]|nr:hypothetical protein [Ignavibacteriales bacterium]
MIAINNISITSNISLFWIILLSIVLIFAVYYYTKKNLSILGKKNYYFSLVIRSLVILLLLSIISRVIINVNYTKSISPKHYIFIDNSKSISNKDGIDRKSIINKILNELNSKDKIYIFGKNVREFNNNLDFKDSETNYNKIFSGLNLNDNISSIVLISDGNQNAGADPIYNIQKLEIPVFTVGVGNPEIINLSVENIYSPENVVVNEKVDITATIKKSGGRTVNAKVLLKENNILINSKVVELKDEVTNVDFSYTPKSEGEKSISVEIEYQDIQPSDNIKKVSINVFNDLKKIVLISGSLSNDVNFVLSSLKANPKNKIYTISVIAKDKILENYTNFYLLDSANVVILIGFPSPETPANLLNYVKNSIKNKSTLFLLSSNIDFDKLKELEESLPFTVFNENNNYIEMYPDFIEAQKEILGVEANEWKNLPPIEYNLSQFKEKNGANVLSFIKTKNTNLRLPLIIQRDISGKRDIAILAKNIWNWKLLLSGKKDNLFNSFVNNSINWLTISDNFNKFKLVLDKDDYFIKEVINLNAFLFDDLKNPMDDENIVVNIKGKKFYKKIVLNNVGNGIYSNSIALNDSGKYEIFAEVLGKNLFRKKIIYVNGIEKELTEKYLNEDYLKTIANISGGKYFNIKNIDSLNFYLNRISNNSSTIKTFDYTFDFLTSTTLLFIIAILLSVEWFIRRRFGLL